MDWINHPKFVPVREAILRRLTKNNRLKFRKLDPVVFLCGGMSSKPRDTLANYITKRSNRLLWFYAEHVWDTLTAQTNLSSLELEKQLADFSDIVIVVSRAQALSLNWAPSH